jgi:hypothetical protein
MVKGLRSSPTFAKHLLVEIMEIYLHLWFQPKSILWPIQLIHWLSILIVAGRPRWWLPFRKLVAGITRGRRSHSSRTMSGNGVRMDNGDRIKECGKCA